MQKEKEKKHTFQKVTYLKIAVAFTEETSNFGPNGKFRLFQKCCYHEN
jgi:hypothetical protein